MIRIKYFLTILPFNHKLRSQEYFFFREILFDSALKCIVNRMENMHMMLGFNGLKTVEIGAEFPR